MKTLLHSLSLTLLLLTSVQEGFAQTSAKNTSVATMCGCPGEIWSFTLPYKPWSNFSTFDHTKRIMHTGYDFNIPATASITGIQVDFDYKTINAPANTVRDSNATILINGTMAGDDQSGYSPFYGTTGHVTLGGPGNTWGLQPSPSDVNASGFGFNVRFYSNIFGPIISFENGVVMTVYYNNAAGISESQRSSLGIKAFYQNKSLKVELESPEKTEIEIYDLTGKKVLKNTRENSASSNTDLSSLGSGIYIYSVKTPSKTKTARFVIED